MLKLCPDIQATPRVHPSTCLSMLARQLLDVLFFFVFVSQLTGFKASRDAVRSLWHSSETRRVLKALDGQRRLESALVSGSLKCKSSQVFPKQLFKHPHQHNTTRHDTVKSENTLVLTYSYNSSYKHVQSMFLNVEDLQ